MKKTRLTEFACAAVLLSALLSGCTGKTSGKPTESNYGFESDKKEPVETEMTDNNEDKKELYDIKDKEDLVSICYSTWFDPVIKKYGDNPYNIAEVLNGKRNWGPLYEFHYWGKPALGYYSSSDKDVIRTHMTQLYDAGIDFIIVDNTNVSMDWKKDSTWKNMVSNPCTALLDTIVEMRAEGLKTPYVSMWCKTNNEDWNIVNAIYDEFITNKKYEECWVYWSEKPFVLVTQSPALDNTKITWRHMWGLNYNTKKCEWSFLQQKNTPNYDRRGKAEQICVCVAAQTGYMSDPSNALGREGGCTFWHQWQNAFESRPKVVTVTWWNEWIAQRFEDNKFVDNYSEEYSRDIEPMEGGHGSKYYDWMKEYIAAYKSHSECPELHD